MTATQASASRIDVNPRAIERARSKHLDIEFQVADANDWSEPPDSWDAVLTMSVLDHIPDDAAEGLATQFAATARHVIAVEVWGGTPGLYKYTATTVLCSSGMVSAHLSGSCPPGSTTLGTRRCGRKLAVVPISSCSDSERRVPPSGKGA